MTRNYFKMWSAQGKLQFFCVLIIVLSHISEGSGVQVDLYESAEFQDLSQTINVDDSEDCVTLQYGRNVVSSVNTHGGCINLYDGVDCKGRKLKIAPGIHSHNNLAAWNFNDVTKSIGSCTAAEQKKKMKPKQFALYSAKWQEESSLLFESTEKPCKCMTLPPSVKRKAMSVNTHGNCLRLYTEDNCGGNSITLAVGSDHHGNLDGGNFGNKASSISGCQGTSSCVRLSATLYRMDYPPDLESRILTASKDKVQMQSTVYIENNGSATFTKEVSAQKSITQRFEFEQLHSLSHMHHVGVEVNFQVCGGVFGFASVQSGGALTYNFVSTSTDQTRRLNATENTSGFEVKDFVAVPACTIYSVETFVNVLDNFRVEYDLLMKIKGDDSGRAMTADELKKSLNQGLTFERVLDKNTIVAKTKGSMIAHVGINSGTKASGRPIPGCVP